jgi:hypothetical protein
MNEIEVKVTQTAGVIESNFEEIKEALGLQMTAYLDLELNEGNIKERKADLATLRKIRKAVDDRRKEVKKTFNKPYEEFESKVKEVLAVIDEPINMIDTGLKGFEEKRVAEKIEHAKAIHAEQVGEFAEYLPFSASYKNTWKNATCSDNEIISDIQEQVVKIKNDLNVIKGLHSEIEEQLLEAYKTTGNLAAVVQKNTDYIEIKRQIEVAEQQKKEADAAREAEKAEPVAEPVTEETPEPLEVPADEGKVTFTVSAWDAASVRQFLEFNEIDYTEG